MGKESKLNDLESGTFKAETELQTPTSVDLNSNPPWPYTLLCWVLFMALDFTWVGAARDYPQYVIYPGLDGRYPVYMQLIPIFVLIHVVSVIMTFVLLGTEALDRKFKNRRRSEEIDDWSVEKSVLLQ